jgi:TatD DNase family protein
MYVDSHCHLSVPELHGQVADILALMKRERVERALTICITLEEFETVHALALRHENLWASVGVHPDHEDVREPTVEDLLSRARLDKVVAIGETGLDYYRLNGRSLEDMHWQRERLRVHVRAARECGLPLIIHTRDSGADTLRILQEEGAEQVGGVFHCFTDSMAVARGALELGFHISFSGIITFKNAGELRDVAREVPLERCLIETDSPYLAPVPYRGKLNTPALVPYVAAELARLKGLEVEAVAQATTRNFDQLFKMARTKVI